MFMAMPRGRRPSRRAEHNVVVKWLINQAFGALEHEGTLEEGVMAGVDPLSMLLSGGVSVGGNLLGSYMSQNFNKQMIEQQEQFQERMSSTAFQRASKDMQAAGINPIMAFGHPATAPSGGAATMQAPQFGTDVISAVSAAQGMAKQQQEIVTGQAQADQLGASTDKTRDEARLVQAQTANELQRHDTEAGNAARGKIIAELYGTGKGAELARSGERARQAGAGGVSGFPAFAGSSAAEGGPDVVRGLSAEGDKAKDRTTSLVNQFLNYIKPRVGAMSGKRASEIQSGQDFSQTPF
jgi:hypothetical protein